MKKGKFYKTSISLLTATSIILMGGCTGKKNNDNQEQMQTQEEACKHLTVYFEDKPVTFKECSDYEIDYSMYNGAITYLIKKNGKILIDGRTDRYNLYDVYHDVTDNEFDIESIQKIKK